MKKLFTILSLMVFVTVIISCTDKYEEKNIFNIKIEPLIIDSAKMYQTNETGNLIETLDTAVIGCKIDYGLSGDTLNATISIPKKNDKFHWNALFDYSKKDKDTSKYVFSTKTGNLIIYNIKDEKVISIEIKNDKDKVIFYIN
jgi:hypothetical protein